MLADQGPALGRPLVDRLKTSRFHNMKELRPASAGASEVRIVFAFDPVREAILLVAGDKSGQWSVPGTRPRYRSLMPGSRSTWYDSKRNKGDKS